MLVGHVAAGFLGKRVAPSLSLGTAVAAGLAADLLWGLFLISGVERFEIVHPGPTLMTSEVGTHIDWSHSLALDLVWAALFAGLYFWWRRDWRAAWVLAAAVLSHWMLDFASHRPDMPLAPGNPRVFGLGLWNSIPATLVVEGGVWILAAVLYVRLRADHAGLVQQHCRTTSGDEFPNCRGGEFDLLRVDYGMGILDRPVARRGVRMPKIDWCECTRRHWRT